MSFLHSAFFLKKDAAGRKSVSSETTEMSEGGGLMFGEESAADFWPVQHPVEPPQGERPVECPMPHSSVINEWRVSRSFQRKAAEPTSKRRHSVSHDGDHHRTLLFHNKSQLFRTSNASTSSRLNKPDQFRRY
ncbi:hypothetical protein ACS0TY_025572 [Phlomoides rotata]